VDQRDKEAGWDPSTFISARTGRGPLPANWQQPTMDRKETEPLPIITIYKGGRKHRPVGGGDVTMVYDQKSLPTKLST
jgi:hypothetical protein